MKFLGETVLVALIFLGGVNCLDSVVINSNNLQVSFSVPIEDVWTDLSRGKTSIKRLMLFQFYYSRVASLSDVLGTWSFHPVRFVLIINSVNVSSSFKVFVNLTFRSQQNASFTKRKKTALQLVCVKYLLSSFGSLVQGFNRNFFCYKSTDIL